MVQFYNHLYIRFRPYKYIPMNIFYYFHAKAVRGAFRFSQYKFIPYLIKMITKFHNGTFFYLFSIITCTRKWYNCSQNLVPSGLQSNFIIIFGRTQYNKLQWIVCCLTSETQIEGFRGIRISCLPISLDLGTLAKRCLLHVDVGTVFNFRGNSTAAL